MTLHNDVMPFTLYLFAVLANLLKLAIPTHISLTIIYTYKAISGPLVVAVKSTQDTIFVHRASTEILPAKVLVSRPHTYRKAFL